ncbi:hypothetical protein B7494_g6884 [Chlorociboria aeruginascens]|nr:hypothetical protein B7494_g6884 [Chlorociboria aeruginascens]
MTSYLSRLSPVPFFPHYTGPFKVGTTDVEFSASQLESPSPAPDDAITTVQYRVFYPCDPPSSRKRAYWIPSPQRGYVSGYSKWGGAGDNLAELISRFTGLLHYISIPAHKNAPVLPPTNSDKRWPVVIFSHGLAGTRNAYSHLCGSLASHGVIVIAPEHRDGSSPVSYMRDVPSSGTLTEKSTEATRKHTVNYIRLPHDATQEVEDGRNTQLKIRCWELGLIHESLVQINHGAELINLNTSALSLSQFRNLMDVMEPGKIVFAGHSFGAATVTQFVKSTFYSPQNFTAPAEYQPLFTPSSRSAIATQITPQTPLILLDIWCMPLRAASSRWLWDKPFPCYTPSGPGGSGLLAVESQFFYKWKVHLAATKRLLSPNPICDDFDYKNGAISQPHLYYASGSAHLSQSDFGVLFPWVVKRAFGADEPERILRLNVRAILQFFRSKDIPVSATSAADMELKAGKAGPALKDDALILETGASIRGWNWLNTNVEDLGEIDAEAEAVARRVGPHPFEEMGTPRSSVSGTIEHAVESAEQELMNQKGANQEMLS